MLQITDDDALLVGETLAMTQGVIVIAKCGRVHLGLPVRAGVAGCLPPSICATSGKAIEG